MKTINKDSYPNSGLVTVAIGCSAGGLVALRNFFQSCPKNPHIAFIVVQHMGNHETHLHDILAKECRQNNLEVLLASEGSILKPNTVFVVPPRHHARVSVGVIRLEKMGETTQKGPHAIDDLFCSLARDQETKVAGVLLSGTGHDGTLGLSTIRDHGGITLAQDNSSAQFSEMPQNAVRNHIVDFVLPPEKMPEELMKFARRFDTPEDDLLSLQKQDLERLFVLLKNKTGVDFSNYRIGTILRRTTKRFASSHLKDLARYVDYLETHPEEIDSLYRDLLINVTGFFRDELNFKALSSTVFPKLVQFNPSDVPLRIWVPGCASGEEAYSLAIGLKEFSISIARPISFTIFATDIDDQALKQARDGLYSECSVTSLPENLLKEYFEPVDGHYRVKKEIRELCVFARQDVIHDPPFSNLDLISCRNLFIYFNQHLQKRVLDIFHYGLKPGRFLFLGASESISPDSELFSGLDKEHRIFQRSQKSGRRLQISGMAPLWEKNQHWRQAPHYRNEPAKARDIKTEVQEILLPRIPWARIVVNEQMTVLFTEGPVDQFLQLPSGVANLNLLKMAKAGLGLELRTAIHKAGEQQMPVMRSGIIATAHRNDHVSVDLEVIPFQSVDSEEDLFLVLLKQGIIEPQQIGSVASAGTIQPTEFKRVEQELIATRELLQSVIEQQDAVAEELKSANEEITARNEELQSSNEELETTKEELQAGNEELTTLNDELVTRNHELNQLNTAVKESEEKFRSLTQSANDAIITCNEKGEIVLWNQGAKVIFGYDEIEMTGKNITEIIPQRYRLAHSAGMRRVLKGGETHVIGRTVEVEGIRKDGSEFPIELSLSRWQLERGSYFTAIVRDVSDRVWMRRLQMARVEITKELLSAQSIDEVISQALRIMCEQMGYRIGAFWKFDPKHQVLRWHLMWPAPTGAYEKLYQFNADLTFSRGSGIPGYVWDKNPIWVQDLYSDPRFTRKEGFRPFDVQSSIAFPIGIDEEFFGLIEMFTSSPLRPEPGVLSLLDDIGSYLNQFIRRKLAEEKTKQLLNELERRVDERTMALAASEARHRFLAEASSLLDSSLDYQDTLQNIADLCIPIIADWCIVNIFEMGAAGQITVVAHANPDRVALARELAEKYPSDPNAKMGSFNVRRTGRSEIVTEITEDMIKSVAKDKNHLQILTDLSLQSYICVPMIAHGNILGTMTLIYSESGRHYQNVDVPLAEEIARRAALAADRIRLLTEAQSANKAKDEFLATLSHELRTPMNIILGWVEILSSERDESTLTSALEMLERNTQIQIKLINDLLDISRITSGKLPVELVPTEIDGIVQSAIRDMKTTADAKGIHLAFIGETVRAPILGDSVRLYQVFQNLINNAIKFTPKGGKINVSTTRSSSHVMIKIQDSGMGIHPDFIKHVFDSFRQEDGSTTRQHGGLGLGLAISRYLVSQHKGRIEVESEGRDKGAAFTVVLPLGAPETQVSSPSTAPITTKQNATNREAVLTNLKILIVDDSIDILYMLEKRLKRRGANVDVATSADEAFDKIRQARYDVILCDIGMPKQDGLSFIKELRTWNPETGGKTPAIAFTAYARKEEIDAAINAGFDAHIAKPAAEPILIETISKIVEIAPADLGYSN